MIKQPNEDSQATPVQDPQITLTRTREAPLTKRLWAQFLALPGLAFWAIFALATLITLIGAVSSIARGNPPIILLLYGIYLAFFIRALTWR